jgi:Flp pilus assembly protein TadG
MSRRPLQHRRKGNVLVLSAVMMVAMMAMLAFAIDLGYLCLARGELQRSADAAAIAAAWDLIDDQALSGQSSVSVIESNARATATQFVGLNRVLRQSAGLGSDDVTIGFLSNPSNPSNPMDLSGLHAPNAVRVRVRRTSEQNGDVPFFFARVLGLDRVGTQAEATAALLTSFRGFQAPADGSNLDLVPFALDLQSWQALLAGTGTDNYRWDENLKQVVAGADGILEVNLYPQGTGSPGNRGTVDIGSDNNSTADIARQLVEGVSPEDLEHHGGRLELDENGELILNGDTGISAGIKDELASIIGKPRIVPLFNNVVGPGNNAQYTIVGFAGIRILNVKLTGSASSKRVIIQPANILARGGISGGEATTSHFVYSPAWLIR